MRRDIYARPWELLYDCFLDLGTSNSFEQSIHETIIAAIEDLLAFSQFVVNFYFCLFTLHDCLKLQLPGELLSRDNDMKIDKDNLPLACTIVVEHTEPRKAWVGFFTKQNLARTELKEEPRNDEEEDLVVELEVWRENVARRLDTDFDETVGITIVVNIASQNDVDVFLDPSL